MDPIIPTAGVNIPTFQLPLIDGIISVYVNGTKPDVLFIEAGEAFLYSPLPRNFDPYLNMIHNNEGNDDMPVVEALPFDFEQVFVDPNDPTKVVILHPGGEGVKFYRYFNDYLIEHHIPITSTCRIDNNIYPEE